MNAATSTGTLAEAAWAYYLEIGAGDAKGTEESRVSSPRFELDCRDASRIH
jgi:hypothetical protein